MNFPRTMLLGLAILGLTAVSVAAKDYKIKLDRPARVGDRYRLWTTETKREAMTLAKDGMVLMKKDKTEKATLQGVVDVQKVDKVGEVLKLQLTVEKFVNAKGDVLLKKGQVVIAETIEKKTAYRLAEGKLPDEAKKRPSYKGEFGDILPEEADSVPNWITSVNTGFSALALIALVSAVVIRL